jgi:hypothetical protein
MHKGDADKFSQNNVVDMTDMEFAKIKKPPDKMKLCYFISLEKEINGDSIAIMTVKTLIMLDRWIDPVVI